MPRRVDPSEKKEQRSVALPPAYWQEIEAIAHETWEKPAVWAANVIVAALDSIRAGRKEAAKAEKAEKAGKPRQRDMFNASKTPAPAAAKKRAPKVTTTKATKAGAKKSAKPAAAPKAARAAKAKPAAKKPRAVPVPQPMLFGPDDVGSDSDDDLDMNAARQVQLRDGRVIDWPAAPDAFDSYDDAEGRMPSYTRLFSYDVDGEKVLLDLRILPAAANATADVNAEWVLQVEQRQLPDILVGHSVLQTKAPNMGAAANMAAVYLLHPPPKLKI